MTKPVMRVLSRLERDAGATSGRDARRGRSTVTSAREWHEMKCARYACESVPSPTGPQGEAGANPSAETPQFKATARIFGRHLDERFRVPGG